MKGWTCPLCDRLFAHRDQPHSCHASNVTKALATVRPTLRPALDALLAFVEDLPQARIEHASGAFMVKAPATFCSIRPRARDLQVMFILATETTEFPIAKTMRLSMHRVAHALFLDGPEALDEQLKGWIRTAHTLTVTKTKPGARRRPAQ